MRVAVVAVGRPKGPLADAIAVYEARAARYWRLELLEVEAGAPGRSPAPETVQEEEGERIVRRLPEALEVVALTRAGTRWSSTQLADDLRRKAVESHPGVTFVVGGAYGLAPEVLGRARRRLALSGFTLPHEMARLVLVEQLYRAGTILRGEPYHKG